MNFWSKTLRRFAPGHSVTPGDHRPRYGGHAPLPTLRQGVQHLLRLASTDGRHNTARECARRRRQIARGMLRIG